MSKNVLFCTFPYSHKIQRKPFVYGGFSDFAAFPPRPLSDPLGVAVKYGGMPIYKRVNVKSEILIGKTFAYYKSFFGDSKGSAVPIGKGYFSKVLCCFRYSIWARRSAICFSREWMCCFCDSMILSLSFN